MHLQGGVFALDDFEVTGLDGDQGTWGALVCGEGMGAALGGLGELVAKQYAAEEHDGGYTAKQTQIGVQWTAVEDLGRVGGPQERGGLFTRSRKQRWRVKS